MKFLFLPFRYFFQSSLQRSQIINQQNFNIDQTRMTNLEGPRFAHEIDPARPPTVHAQQFLMDERKDGHRFSLAVVKGRIMQFCA